MIQTQGLNGRVILFDELSSSKPLLKLDHLFIELQKGSFIPFFSVEKPMQIEEGKTAWQLDEIDTAEAARTLVGKDAYIETKRYNLLFPSRSSLDEDLSGFLIKDNTSGNSGIIESVITSPGQLLANVLFQEKEVLIPLAESFVLGIDPQKKLIKMKLPEGIWDL